MQTIFGHIKCPFQKSASIQLEFRAIVPFVFKLIMLNKPTHSLSPVARYKDHAPRAPTIASDKLGHPPK